MNRLIRVCLILSIVANSAGASVRPRDPGDAPLVRGPGVSQEEFEIFAEAQARTTLADYLDLERPGDEATERLRFALEHAQSDWLGGSLDSARSRFQTVARMALDADWREPQREAIHFAQLRLAQASKTARERAEWIDAAVSSFPDLQADPSVFPPPLIEEFRSARAKRLGSAKTFELGARFAGFRYLLINGRRFDLRAVEKIRLPDADLRVTLLSDSSAPVTTQIRRDQLDGFQAARPALASGDCANPGGAEPFASLRNLSVLFTQDCVRTRDGKAWLPLETEAIRFSSDRVLNPAVSLAPSERLASTENPAPRPDANRKWMWVGVALLGAATYVVYREMNRESQTSGPTEVRPVHRDGL